MLTTHILHSDELEGTSGFYADEDSAAIRTSIGNALSYNNEITLT